MYEKIADEIQTETKRLSELQRATIDGLLSLKDSSGNTISVATPISDNDRSISDIDTLSSSIVRLSEGFKDASNWAFVPRGWIDEFRDGLKNTANSFDNLKSNITAVEAQHGGLATIDIVNFIVNTKSGTPVDVRKILGNISLNIDKAFEAYFRLRQATSAPQLSEFGELFSFFSTRKKELDSLSKELSLLADRGREAYNALKSASDAAKAGQAEVARLREDTEKDRKSAGEYANESSQRLESIKATNKTADELNAAVTNYQATFNQFQAQLEERNKTYESQKSAFSTLKSALDLKEQEVARLTQQAEDMLKGATNAGLAGSYSQKQQSTDGELKSARMVYYISIALLVFLTLPIFLYSFPREFLAEIWKIVFHTDAPALLVGQGAKTWDEHLINLIGRAVFLIPGFLFVRFASSRHAQLFRLREDYSYKYSIAASVEGFMKQAKTYADEIAASSYFELTYNPTDKMDGSAEDSRMPNPIWEKFMSKIEGLKFKRNADTMQNGKK